MSPPVFALPSNTIHSYAQQRPINRKRKRSEQRAKEQAAEEARSGGQPADPRSIDDASSLAPIEKAQRRLAGQPFNEDLPPPPFPHARVPSLKDDDTLAQPPSAGNARVGLVSDSLRNQHMAAMTAILHKSIMDEDYVRARRALGLMLRSELGGQPVDIRSHGRWGIGAEILLRYRHSGRRRADERAGDATSSIDRYGQTPTALQSKQAVTQAGFADVKQYYSTLGVQYPYHKAWPDAVSSLDFQVAMFGLWIHVVHEGSRESQRAASEESRSPDVTAEELDGAREIAVQMDKTMSSVPYSDSIELIRLRAMVALWVADLEDWSVGEGPVADLDAIGSEHAAMEAQMADVSRVDVIGREDDMLSSSARASQSRALAERLLAKLAGRGRAASPAE